MKNTVSTLLLFAFFCVGSFIVPDIHTGGDNPQVISLVQSVKADDGEIHQGVTCGGQNQPPCTPPTDPPPGTPPDEGVGNRAASDNSGESNSTGTGDLTDWFYYFVLFGPKP